MKIPLRLFMLSLMIPGQYMEIGLVMFNKLFPVKKKKLLVSQRPKVGTVLQDSSPSYLGGGSQKLSISLNNNKTYLKNNS